MTDWPPGTGEMAGRVRAHDWSATPLGPLAQWPALLRMATTLVLDNVHPAVLVWGRDLTTIHNDAYLPLLGPRANALGRPFLDVWSDAADTIAPQLARAMAGEASSYEGAPFTLFRSDVPEERFFDYSFSPVRDETGEVAGVLNFAVETTARIREARSRAEFQETEERQRFMLRLSDALRPLAEAHDIRATACRVLGEHLGADRVYYLDYEIEKGFGIVADDYSAEGLPSVAGRYPFEAFRSTYERIGNGETWTVPDMRIDDGIAAAERDFYAAQQVIAWVDVPLLKQESLHAVLCVVQTKPRDWTSGEIALVEETAERLWASVRRARVEAALREREQRLQIALEAGRMGTYRLDLRTGQQEWSPEQYEIFGLPRTDAPLSRDGFLAMVLPEDQHRVQFSSDDLRSPGTYLDAEFRIARADGEVRSIVAHALALFDESNRPVELIGVNQDVTEQRRLEAAMHSTEERLREFSEASSDILWIRSADDLQWEYLSPAFHRIYGISRADALRGDNLLGWAELIVDEDREAALAAIRRVRDGERVTFEYRVRRPEDGEIRWLRNTDFPLRDESGQVRRIAGIGHDLTEIKLAEQHQRFLHAELQHRVRNTLAVIRSILRRTAAKTDTKDEFFTHLDSRIAAFARVQAAVTRDPSKPLDLALLVAEELRVAGAQEGDLLSIEGPAVGLSPRAAESLGLAVHELCSNAIKYGALASHRGRIEVRWSVDADGPEPMLRFSWQEHDVADMPPEPRRQGFGMEVLERTLGYEMRAETELTFRPDGISLRLSIPMAELTTGVPRTAVSPAMQ